MTTMTMPSDDGSPPPSTVLSKSTFSAEVSLLAASYATTYYAGTYQGASTAVGWSMGRYSAGASLSYYHLLENGADQAGIGDVLLHAGVTLFHRPTVDAGVILATSLPTGDDLVGLGMGQVMLMPATWGTWRHDRLVLSASGGYSRVVAGMATMMGMMHGPMSLVDPMNMSELSWSAGGEVTIGRGVRAAARMSGGIPIGAIPGVERVIGALRVAWGTGRVDTGAELQAGLAGDPFTIRGVVETSLRF